MPARVEHVREAAADEAGGAGYQGAHRPGGSRGAGSQTRYAYRRGRVTAYACSIKAGLCDSCRRQRIVRNTRGSAFSLCERSKVDERYRKYPRLPVERCPG